jgi:hypothetical protein
LRSPFCPSVVEVASVCRIDLFPTGARACEEMDQVRDCGHGCPEKHEEQILHAHVVKPQRRHRQNCEQGDDRLEAGHALPERRVGVRAPRPREVDRRGQADQRENEVDPCGHARRAAFIDEPGERARQRQRNSEKHELAVELGANCPGIEKQRVERLHTFS